LIILLTICFFAASVQAADTLSVAVSSALASLDPQAENVTSDQAILVNIFDTLITRNKNGELEPDLATSWKMINKTTWQFHLRKGVKFHNGNKFTWKDVKYTFNRLGKPKVSGYINIGQRIASVKPVKGNPWVIQIRTKTPVPYFAQELTDLFIMDKESSVSRSRGEIGTNSIGTGPYYVKKWVRNSYIKLEANSQYWGQQPSITHVVVYPIKQASTRFAAIATGKVDLVKFVPVVLLNHIKNNPKLKVISLPSRRSIFLELTNKPNTPMANLKVRKAMYMAINERAIINKVLFGHGAPASQIPDPKVAGYDKNIKRLHYDPKRAKALLKKAGYGAGFNITLAGPVHHYVQDKQIVAAIASQLAKVSINVNVDTMPQSVYFGKMAKQDFTFALMGWHDSPHDFAHDFNALLHTPNAKKGHGSLNGVDFSSTALDKQYAKASKIVDLKKRREALQKLNRMAMKRVAVIPLHYQENDYAVRKGIGFEPRLDTYLVFKNMSIGKPAKN
jgi:peptide/nickel transport system substrate-binding protein